MAAGPNRCRLGNRRLAHSFPLNRSLGLCLSSAFENPFAISQWFKSAGLDVCATDVRNRRKSRLMLHDRRGRHPLDSWNLPALRAALRGSVRFGGDETSRSACCRRNLGFSPAHRSRGHLSVAAALASLDERGARTTGRAERASSGCVETRGNSVTRSLRQRHRRLWLVLGVLLPVVFITGLLV